MFGASRELLRGFIGAGNERPRIGVRAARQFLLGQVEGVRDFGGARHQRARRRLGALGDLTVGVAEGVAGLLGQRGRDFEHFLAQCASNHHGTLFEHLTDVVDAGRKCALHGPGALLDDAGLAAERILDPADIVSQHVGDLVAAVGKRAHMALHDVVQLGARVGDLVQIVFQRAGEHVASVRELGDVAGHGLVDR